jgi:hypothetical protein
MMEIKKDPHFTTASTTTSSKPTSCQQETVQSTWTNQVYARAILNKFI